MTDVPDNRRYEDRVNTGALRWAEVTPSDSENFAELPKGIFVGSAGLVSAVGADDQPASFFVTEGQTVPIRPKRVNETGTTATGIVALFGPAA